jgi:hypothetical protein
MELGRREFLKLTGLGLAGLGAGLGGIGGIGGNGGGTSFAEIASDENRPLYGGWINSPVARRKFIETQRQPFLRQMNEKILGTGKGRTVLLWPYLEKAYNHELVPHYQQIGDCVSHGYGLGVDVLSAVQMYQTIAPQEWIAESATEIIYGGCRVQTCSVGRIPGDGAVGIDAAAFVSKYGTLLRQKYLNGKFDFSIYSGGVARELGRTGVAVALQPLCRLHPVQTVTLVNSWVEVRDAVANGYPVTMCSNIGFNTNRGRDREGFLVPGRQPWYHCMLIAGIDDSDKRPGGLIINSWGTDWISGPTRLNQPAGSFWADASVIDRAMKQGDSVAISNYIGYPMQNLDYRFF